MKEGKDQKDWTEIGLNRCSLGLTEVAIGAAETEQMQQGVEEG